VRHKLKYNPQTKEFGYLDAHTSLFLSEDGTTQKIPVFQLVTVFTSLLEWVLARFQRTPEEREAIREYRAMKKDKKRQYRLERLRLKLAAREA
jgi:ubiquinone biosynthesis protein Coq4